MWSSAEIRGPGGTAELGPLGRAALERMNQDVGALVRLSTTDEIPLTDDPPEIEMLLDRITPAATEDMVIESDGMSSQSGGASMTRSSPLRRFSDWRASRKRRRLERLATSLGLSIDDIAPQLGSSDHGSTHASAQVRAPVQQVPFQPMGGGSCPLCGAIGAISGGSCQRCGASFDRVD